MELPRCKSGIRKVNSGKLKTTLTYTGFEQQDTELEGFNTAMDFEQLEIEQLSESSVEEGESTMFGEEKINDEIERMEH